MIGTKIYKPVDIEKYSKVAEWCNLNNATIVDKGEYYEVVEIIPQEPTIEEQVIHLEKIYKMNRWQREIILAENSGASEYSKTKAQEIEDIAEQLRG